MVRAGIDFNQKHFDIAFSICGRSSTMFQLLTRVRILNENKIMLWIEREREGKSRVPKKKQLIKELGKRHKRGCKMSPHLIPMPPLLKTVYIDRLQREKRTKRKIGQEVEKMLIVVITRL